MGSFKGALMGYGFIASQGHAPAWRERMSRSGDVEIVAIADICDARRLAARQDFPEARVYTDAFSLLASESHDLDFVDIATPPGDHAPIARAALEAGCHVLCEKPLTTTYEQALSLAALARQAGRVLFPCHNYKHAPVIRGMHQALADHRLGPVRGMTLSTFRNTHAKGVPEWRPHWRRDSQCSGGGIAMDHGSHTFYLTFDWFQEYPTTVSARTFSAEPSKHDTEDTVSAVLTFPSGLAHVYLTWRAGMRKVIYTVHAEKGALKAEDDTIEVARLVRADGPDVAQGAVRWEVEKHTCASHWMDASHSLWYESLFEEFLQSFRERESWGSKDLQEAVLCVGLIESLYRSARDGGRETAVPRPDPSL